jgi:hypothetical protein
VTSPSSISHRRQRSGSGAAPSRSQATDWLGTVGWAAKGVLYLLIAALAIQLALSGGTDADQASKQGAMQSLVDKPFGSALLVIIVIGLFAYAAYRLVTVVMPAPGSDDDGKKKLGKQAVHLGSAVAYAVAGAQGISVLMGKSSGGGETQQKTWSATLLSSTPGTLALLAVGIGFLVFAGWQVRKGVTRSFLKKLDCPTGSFINRRSVGWIGVTGLLARGVVAALLGIFVVVAVWRHDPNEVRGLDGALRSLIDAPAGPVLLMIAALGLAAYGVFALVCSRCRRHELG